MGDQPKATGGIPGRYKNLKLDKPVLFHLAKDIGEGTDVSAEHPDVVEKPLKFADKMRADLGDSLTKTIATGAREPGRLPAK